MKNIPNKLNIAMICDSIGDSKAGVIVSTIRFAKLLKKMGHNVIFIGARSKEYNEHGYHEGIKTYRYKSIPIPRSGGWNLAFPTVNKLKLVFKEEKIDIVHIILPMSASIFAIRAAHSLGIKIVAHSHSQPENLFMDAPKIIQPLLYDMWNKYLSWVYGKSEVLIYPSRLANSLLDKLNKTNHPSIVISNGINTDEYRQIPIGDFLKRFNIQENTVKLLYVGRLFPEKSIDTLIQAFSLLVDKNLNTHLMIVGAGHSRQKLEKIVGDLGINSHVTFLGLVSDQDKIFAYNACDIFVLPSLAELEGMVVLEAMACGKPILIADAKMSASRFLVEGNGFLFEAKNPKDLAEQATKLILNADLRSEMGLMSLKNSKDHDINISVASLEKVYRSVLEKR
jgi:glycosyltransferase involved in cell wall biosynthesis